MTADSAESADPPGDLIHGLAARLPGRRWFADKSAPILSLTCVERLTAPAVVGFGLALVDVQTAVGRPPRRYVVVEAGDGSDAACTPTFAHWLLETVFSGSTVSAGAGGRFVGHPIGPTAVGDGSVRDAGRLAVKPLGPDASNTSFVVGTESRSFVVKLFRTCRPGVQPEVEAGEFFAGSSPWSGTPRLCGWLEYARDELTVAIATVHEFVPGCTTAWDHLVGLLAGPKHEGESAVETAALVAAALGRTTAAMHRALAARTDRPAFAALPATSEWWRSVVEGMRRHATDVFARIATRLPQFSDPMARRIAAIIDAKPELLARFDGLAEAAIRCDLIRVHGDYHLGQVLVAAADAVSPDTLIPERALFVIDFEGEPGRSLDERRSRTAAAKDVAGMCRSFDYLVRHAGKLADRPHDPADTRRLERAFLESYHAASAGQPWWPATTADASRVLAAFSLDKAIYELAYEFDNRPDWIDVPLGALEGLVVHDSKPGLPDVG